MYSERVLVANIKIAQIAQNYAITLYTVPHTFENRIIMKTNAELMASLQQELDNLLPKAVSGDESAQVKWAMGQSLYEYLAKGYKLTSLDWFKYTPYYSYSPANLKKAA